MPVRHIVLFGFKPDASPDSIKQCCDEMLRLKEQCVLASTGETYITASSGGKDVSIEGLQNGFTHAFVVEFASAADRDFYVNEDKAHHAFVDRWIKSADGIAAKAMVVDFAPGSF
ncbi:uncharacterized protein UV8b_04814 [Ustilaginoidea virens]|uniref:Stress-response A/B barrel domain-containing protein n=1 Tax=Ustilaginoidea virens TaxID=1159556 RepID=A0A063BPZ3_USTVR|nr:uncharacterized protein UV8b_04814 [Ustilaginoidea virens]QUC20573.1 hypothetical protein UV8b_04814 [Ustilaginoidea virens]GAO15633.1 hypothetical protein UVI_02050640 [Ustilaginoidea virens]